MCMLHVLPFKSTAQSLWCSVIGVVEGDQLSTRLWGSVGGPDVRLASDAMLTQALKTEGGKSRFLSIPFLHSDTDHLDPSLLPSPVYPLHKAEAVKPLAGRVQSATQTRWRRQAFRSLSLLLSKNVFALIRTLRSTGARELTTRATTQKVGTTGPELSQRFESEKERDCPNMSVRPVVLRRALRSALRPGAKSSSFAFRPFCSTAPVSAPNTSTNGSPEYAVPNPSRPTHFGYETVTEAEKRERVAGVFTSVAESYDRMNDLMSFGWHRIWK